MGCAQWPIALAALWLSLIPAFLSAASAEGIETRLHEKLITVTVQGNAIQVGVLSKASPHDSPSNLAVLLPGYPSVVKPQVEGHQLVKSSLMGNFLIRARRHLVSEQVATLIVDCKSTIGLTCTAAYQASPDRQQDVQRLIDQVREELPSVRNVWLVGTSMGTISSSFMPRHAPAGTYQGVIHTAAITEPHAKNSYLELVDFDYRRVNLPQFLIHHRDDPCPLTTWDGAKRLSKRFNLPLITVLGGSDFKGKPCAAFTEHGFRGMEKNVMNAIKQIMSGGSITDNEIK